MKALILAAGLVYAAFAAPAHAEVQDCIEIVSLPATITQQGVHCFKKDLNTSATTGAAITVNAPNVTIEMNGFKLGGLGGGPSTTAKGIYAVDRQNITIRNGTIRGFYYNVYLNISITASAGSGHLLEDLRIESARYMGIFISGTRSTIRNNIVFDIGNGAAAQAFGIIVQNGEGHSIMGNSVTGVTETTVAYGIYAAATVAPFIRGNQVRNISAGTSYGILTATSPRPTIQDNLVSNAMTGNTAILSEAPSACIENVVTNFSFGISGCSVNERNVTF